MWEVLTSTSTVLGIVGSLFSVITFFRVKSINNKMIQISDQKTYKHEKKIIISQIRGLKESMQVDGLYNSKTIDKLNEIIISIPIRYSFFSLKTKFSIKKIKILLKKMTKADFDYNNKKYENKLYTNMVILTEKLAKEN